MEHALAHQKLEGPSGPKSRGKEEGEQSRLPFSREQRDQLVERLANGNKELMSHRSSRGAAASPFAPGKNTMKAPTTAARSRPNDLTQASGSRSSPLTSNATAGPSNCFKPQAGRRAVEGSRQALPPGKSHINGPVRNDSIKDIQNPFATGGGRGTFRLPGVGPALGSSDIDGPPVTRQRSSRSPQHPDIVYVVDDGGSPPLFSTQAASRSMGSDRPLTRNRASEHHGQQEPTKQRSDFSSTTPPRQGPFDPSPPPSYPQPRPSRPRPPTSDQTSPFEPDVIDLAGPSPPAKNTRKQAQSGSSAPRLPPDAGEPERLVSGGAFGSHKSKHSPGPVRGRMNNTRSISPTKRSTDRNEPAQMLFPSDDEVQESVERDDPIEDPDGPFREDWPDLEDNDFQLVEQGSRAATSLPGGDGSCVVVSPEKEGSGRTAPFVRKLRAMKTKAGSSLSPKASTVQNKGKQSANSAIQSSVKRRLASIRYSRLADFPLAVPATTVSLDRRGLSLSNRTNTMLELPLSKMVDLTTQDSGDHPLLMAEFRLAPGDRLVDELENFCHINIQQYSEKRLQHVKVLIAFMPRSVEAYNLLTDLRQFAVQEGCNDVSLLGSDEAARSILEGLQPVELEDGTRTKRRSAKSQAAEAAEKRWRKGKDTRVDEEDEFDLGTKSSRDKAVKGKAKAKDDSSQSKLSFQKVTGEASTLAGSEVETQAGRRTSRRLTGQPARVYRDLDDDDVQSVPPPRSMESALSVEERRQMLFPYPPEGRPDLTITRGDRARVTMDDFLNDTLLEFGLRYVVDSMGDEIKKRIHLFNSFFYDKLTNKKGKWVSDDSVWPGYESIKKWTKNRNIFEKEFIIVPINENFHWYLAVIYNPAGILKERPPNEEETTTPTSLDRVDALADLGDDSKPDRSSPVKNDPQNGDWDELTGNYGEGDQQLAPSEESAAPPVNGQDETNHVSVYEILDDADEANGAADQSTMSIDPLMMTDNEADRDGLVTRNVNDAADGVRSLTISQHPNGEAASAQSILNPPSSPGLGGAIMTPTMRAVEQQRLRPSEAVPQIPDANDKPAPKAGKPDHNIWQSGQCWIFTCDSLGGAHKEVGRSLERWLFYEARDKKVITHNRPSSAPYIEAKVPSQPNFSDCGLFLIHYVKQLLQHTEEIMTFIEKPMPRPASEKARWELRKQAVWRAESTGHLRKDWTEIIDELTAKSNSLRTMEPQTPLTPVEDDSQDDIHFVTEGHDAPVGSETRRSADAPATETQLRPNIPERLQAPSNAPELPADNQGQDVQMKETDTPETEELVEQDEPVAVYAEVAGGLDSGRLATPGSDIDPNLDSALSVMALNEPRQPPLVWARRASLDDNLQEPLTADTVHPVDFVPTPLRASVGPSGEVGGPSESAPSETSDTSVLGTSSEAPSLPASSSKTGYRTRAGIIPPRRGRTIDVDMDADDGNADCSPFDNLGKALGGHGEDDGDDMGREIVSVESRPPVHGGDPEVMLDVKGSDGSSNGDWRDLEQRGVPLNGDSSGPDDTGRLDLSAGHASSDHQARDGAVVAPGATPLPRSGQDSSPLTSPPLGNANEHLRNPSSSSMGIGINEVTRKQRNDMREPSDQSDFELPTSTPATGSLKRPRTYSSKRKPAHTTQLASSKRTLPDIDTPTRTAKKSRPSGETESGQMNLTRWTTSGPTTKEKEAVIGNGTSKDDAIELDSTDEEGGNEQIKGKVNRKGGRRL